MNVLFLTMAKMMDIEQKGIYTDLLRRFRDEGHAVYVVTPSERRDNLPTELIRQESVSILRVKTLNVQKANVVEKGLGQVSLEYLYMQAMKKHFGNAKFDLILYSTPPITFTKVIQWVRRKNPQAKTYLMLKDIFPQNAVDLGMLVDRFAVTRGGDSDSAELVTSQGSVSGERLAGMMNPVRFVKYMLYRSFRKKEKKLYAISDYIGCMSPANVKYVLEHNQEVQPEKVELCPNTEDAEERLEFSGERLAEIRSKFVLPVDKPIFIYGGNLGKPQGIPFLTECLKANARRSDCHFVVIGSGTEYARLAAWYDSEKPSAVSVFKSLPKAEYAQLASACDVGLIFLDYRFTIPNYPSRLLAYLKGKKPVIACTDPNCDTGSIAEANGYGFGCPSNSVEAFTQAVDKMLASDIQAMGERGYQFFLDNYTTEHAYKAIMKHLK